MSDVRDVAAAVRARFSELNLSDGRLLGIHTEQTVAGDLDNVRLDLELVTGHSANEWMPATMWFTGCAAISLRMDFWGKRAIRSAILDNECFELSDQALAAMEHEPARERQQPFAGLTEFVITLSLELGELRVVAQDFRCT